MDSTLKFDIYERVHLDTSRNGISSIVSTELTPQIKMHLCKEQIKIVGNLLLKITYVGVIPFKTSNFEHKIPVEITIPSNRIKDAWLIDADIENFAVDIVGTHAINVTGKLVVYEKEPVKVEKVKLPKEVAEVIDGLRNTGHPNRGVIVEKLHREGERQQDKFTQIDLDIILQALVNGYEVEETPEDKVRAYYNQQNSICTEQMDTGSDVIRKVLNLLGKEIVGVNA